VLNIELSSRWKDVLNNEHSSRWKDLLNTEQTSCGKMCSVLSSPEVEGCPQY